MSFPRLYPDFVDLLSSFLEENVAFLLVGAFAVAANGVVRATGDLDVWVRPDEENEMGLPPMRIDVLTHIDGVVFDQAWDSRIVADVGGLPLPFLGRRELVRNKRAAGRKKDLQDLELLREAGVPVDDP